MNPDPLLQPIAWPQVGGGGGGDDGDDQDCSNVQAQSYPESYPDEANPEDLEAAAERAFELIRDEVGAEKEQEIVYGIYANADGEVSIKRIKAGPIGDRYDGEPASVNVHPSEMFDGTLGKLVGWVHNQFNSPDPSAGDVSFHQSVLSHPVANVFASADLVMFIGQMGYLSGEPMELNGFADVKSEDEFDRKNLFDDQSDGSC